MLFHSPSVLHGLHADICRCWPVIMVPGSGPGPPQRGVSPTEGVFTYNVISGSNSSRGSGVSSPCQPFSPPPTIATPLVFSPPMSPFSLTPTPPNTQVYR